jgi:uncharacterized membrane protein
MAVCAWCGNSFRPKARHLPTRMSGGQPPTTRARSAVRDDCNLCRTARSLRARAWYCSARYVLRLAADIFVQIVPKMLPWPMGLVWISGVFEILLGLGLLLEATRRLAGYGLVALYLAVFPANIYMALANVQVQGLPSWATQPSALALWLRLPLQVVFVAWALWASKPSSAEVAAAR